MTRSSGFTLIELLVVVAIIGILSAIGTLSYTGYVSGAKIKSAENYAQQISLAEAEYYTSNGEYYHQGDDACTSESANSSNIETNLFSGRNVLDEDIGFEFCVFGSGSTYTVQAENEDGCTIVLEKNGAPVKTGCWLMMLQIKSWFCKSNILLALINEKNFFNIIFFNFFKRM